LDGCSWVDLMLGECCDVFDGYCLVYVLEVLVNWCFGFGTVLSNEEVINEGCSECGNFLVFKWNLC